LSDALEIKKRKNYVNIAEMKPQEQKIGNKIVKRCLNCNKIIPERNSKYCSLECANQFFVKHNQRGIASYVFKRERGMCQKCGWQNPYFHMPRPKKPGYQESYQIYRQKMDQYNQLYDRYINALNKWREKHKNCKRREFIADHIVPIALGGDEFDPKNVQLLCEVCNKKKTKLDQGKIARKRRLIKMVGKNASTLPKTEEKV
jgi:5-methylcytosine-specific restriction endonuclease McrA